MKLILVTSLSLVFLTGCDNFQLQKPLAKTGLTDVMLKNDANPYANLQNPPSIDQTNRPGSQQGAPAPTTIGKLETKPAKVAELNPSIPSDTPPPVSMAPSKNTPDIAVAPAPTATADEKKETTAVKTEEKKEEVTASTKAEEKKTEANTSSAKSEEKKEVAATSQTDEKKSEAAAPTKAEEKKAEPTKESQKTETATSEKKAETKAEDKATATAQAAEKKEEKSESKKDEKKDSEGYLTVSDLTNLNRVMFNTFGKDIAAQATRPKVLDGENIQDNKTEASGTYQKFTLKLIKKGQTVVEAKDVSLELQGMNHFVLKNGDQKKAGEKDYEMVAVCSGAKCEVMFAVILKSNEKGALLENHPTILKLVKGQYKEADVRTKEEYQAEFTALGGKIKPVPQLVVGLMLEEFLDKNAQDIGAQVQKRLASDPKLAYSDRVLGDKTMKPESFNPKFIKENGKQMVSAQLEFTTPKKPIVFKGEIAELGPSKPIQTESGLSMTVISAVKDQAYIVIMDQSKFTSKIQGVDKAFQIAICTKLEEEGHNFGNCLVVVASSFLEKGNDDVYEFNAKEKLKEAQ